MWQSDFTHIRHADGTDTEVISWLDDHSRFLLHITCHRRITGPIVVESFLSAADIHGLPAATLTDNGMVYNTRRPHRALGRATPHTVYTTGIKDAPRIEIAGQPWRVRCDLIDQAGTTTIRYAGRLRHLGIGRTHTGTRVIALAHGHDVMVLAPGTGEIIAEFHINPTKNYQPKNTKPDPGTEP